MDAGSLAVLQRLIALGGRSFLQYVSESSPWTTDQTEHALAQICALAEEERGAVTRLVRFLQRKHARPIVLGSYPAHFTMMNFMTVDWLLPKLRADAEKQVAEIEKGLAAATDEEVRTLTQEYLEMKRRHLQTLNELSAPPVPV
jgi:hypothetical protein